MKFTAILFFLVAIGLAIVIPVVTGGKTTQELYQEMKDKWITHPKIDRTTVVDTIKCSQEKSGFEEGTSYFDIMLGKCVQYCKPFDKINHTRFD